MDEQAKAETPNPKVIPPGIDVPKDEIIKADAELPTLDEALEFTDEEKAALELPEKVMNRAQMKKLLRGFGVDQHKVLTHMQKNIALFQENVVKRVNEALEAQDQKNKQLYGNLVRHIMFPVQERISALELSFHAMGDYYCEELFKMKNATPVSPEALEKYKEEFNARMKERIEELGKELVENAKKQAEENKEAEKEKAEEPAAEAKEDGKE